MSQSILIKTTLHAVNQVCLGCIVFIRRSNHIYSFPSIHSPDSSFLHPFIYGSSLCFSIHPFITFAHSSSPHNFTSTLSLPSNQVSIQSILLQQLGMCSHLNQKKVSKILPHFLPWSLFTYRAKEFLKKSTKIDKNWMMQLGCKSS